MVRLTGAETRALVGSLVVHGPSRVVCDVDDPVGQAGEPLGDAGASGQVGLLGLELGVGLLGLVDRASLVVGGPVIAAAAAATKHTGNADEQNCSK